MTDVETTTEIWRLEERITELEIIIGRLRLRGLDNLDFENLFAASGGDAGTSKQAARSDHVH